MWGNTILLPMELLTLRFVPVLQWKALEIRNLYEETLYLPSVRQISIGSHKIISKCNSKREQDFKCKKTHLYISSV